FDLCRAKTVPRSAVFIVNIIPLIICRNHIIPSVAAIRYGYTGYPVVVGNGRHVVDLLIGSGGHVGTIVHIIGKETGVGVPGVINPVPGKCKLIIAPVSAAAGEIIPK